MAVRVKQQPPTSASSSVPTSVSAPVATNISGSLLSALPKKLCTYEGHSCYTAIEGMSGEVSASLTMSCTGQEEPLGSV